MVSLENKKIIRKVILVALAIIFIVGFNILSKIAKENTIEGNRPTFSLLPREESWQEMDIGNSGLTIQSPYMLKLENYTDPEISKEIYQESKVYQIDGEAISGFIVCVKFKESFNTKTVDLNKMVKNGIDKMRIEGATNLTYTTKDTTILNMNGKEINATADIFDKKKEIKHIFFLNETFLWSFSFQRNLKDDNGKVIIDRVINSLKFKN